MNSDKIPVCPKCHGRGSIIKSVLHGTKQKCDMCTPALESAVDVGAQGQCTDMVPIGPGPVFIQPSSQPSNHPGADYNLGYSDGYKAAMNDMQNMSQGLGSAGAGSGQAQRIARTFKWPAGTHDKPITATEILDLQRQHLKQTALKQCQKRFAHGANYGMGKINIISAKERKD